MTITFATFLFLLFFLFKGLQKNVFFLFYVCAMVFSAHLCETYLGWRIKPFSMNCFFSFVLFHIPLINFFTFLAYGRDKSLARKKAWRIPEIQLHTLELMGGTLGAILAQKFFHHKYKKKSFMATFWATVFIQFGILYFILRYLRLI